MEVKAWRAVKIWENVFENAPTRDPSDYMDYVVGGEHPTQFDPNHEILRYPSKYNVGTTSDKDLCKKNSKAPNNGKSAGIFSMGCAYPLNITLGFELMLERESPQNAFCLLQC